MSRTARAPKSAIPPPTREPKASARPVSHSMLPAPPEWGRFQTRSFAAQLGLAAGTLALASLAFGVRPLWPLAYVCLVPWAIGSCTALTSRSVYFASWLVGVAFFAINAAWLYDVTGPGYIALCLWFGLVFPLVAWPVRHLFRRYSAPVTLTLPVAWTALEFLRGQTLVGFPWFYLAHTHYRVATMIQVADLAGAYGVSFVIAMVNGCLTDIFIQPVRPGPGRRLRRVVVVGAAATVIVVAASFFYGRYRLSESASTRVPGPRVAIVQQDFPNYVSSSVNQVESSLGFDSHLLLARQAARERPDIIVMPETAAPCSLNREMLEASDLEPIRQRLFPDWTGPQLESNRQRYRQFDRAIRDLTADTGAAVAVGGMAIEWRPADIPERVKRFNSVYMYPPGGKTYAERYDKIHLVLFGEFVPFRYTSFHTVYLWLNRCMPFSDTGREYSLDFGEAVRRFQVQARSQAGRSYRFAAPVCYEDVVTDVIRDFADGGKDEKQIDFLLSVSNDGWFNHSPELEQHLSACVFRAVEYRVPIARSVNTGISAIIDPIGSVTGRVELSPDQIGKLGAVEAALKQIQALADELRQRAGPSSSAHQDLQRAVAILHGQLAEALSAVAAAGPYGGKPPAPSTRPSRNVSGRDLQNEFDFLRWRLVQLVANTQVARPQAKALAWSAVSEQAAADLETVDRWRRRSYTAPGCRVAELVCDSRQTIYSQWGDWFALGCTGLTGMMLMDWTVRRLRRPSRKRRRELAREKSLMKEGQSI